MSYAKCTVISGYTTRKPNGWNEMTPDERYNHPWFANSYKSVSLRGHWSAEAAKEKADKMGLKYNRKMSHHINDLSGKGRGGEVAEIKI